MSVTWMERLSLSRNVHQFLVVLEKLAANLEGVESGRFYFYHEDSHQLERQGKWFPVDETSQPGQCAELRETIASPASLPGETVTAAVSVPVRSFGRLVGVLSVVSGTDRALDRSLAHLAQTAGVSYDGVLLKQENDSFVQSSRDLLVRAVEALSSEGKGHVNRVVKLVSDLGTLLDLSAQSKHELFEAAHYHDVGILMLEEPRDLETRKAHPRAGAEFLQSAHSLRHLGPLVLHHHERYDGSGYPDGLAGDAVPIEGWILALAEDLDEYWQNSFKTSTPEKLAEFYESRAPSHHPDVVDALSGLIDSGKLDEIF